MLLAIVAAPVLSQGAPPAGKRYKHRHPWSLLDDRFTILHTEHFELADGTSGEDTTPLLRECERVFDEVTEYRKRLGLCGDPVREKLRVIVLESPEQLRLFWGGAKRLIPSHVGFYDESTNVVMLVPAVRHPQVERITERIEELQRETGEDRSRIPPSPETNVLVERMKRLLARRDELVETINRLIIRHELAHLVMFNAGLLPRGRGCPPWMVEGLACRFEYAKADQKAGLVGQNPLRAADLREAFGLDHRNGAHGDLRLRGLYDRAVAAGRIRMVVELIKARSLADGNGDRAAYGYAQAWSFVAFLEQRHPLRWSACLRELWGSKPRAGIAAQTRRVLFEASAGGKAPDLEREWLDYLAEQLQVP